ncbi:MAG: hypothetical protein N2486_01905 [Caloramator sp.]|nr:hypothetical protein [Caloramator sp.]
MGEIKQEETKYALVDFLYKDYEIINSLFAQIFKGNLFSIEMAQTTQELINGTGGLKAIFFDGKIESEKKRENKTSRYIDPHDLKIINLFQSLNLHVTDSLSNCKDNQIILIKGSLTIRDLSIVKKIFPKIETLGLIPEFNQPWTQKNKKIKTFGDFIEAILELVPSGIELEIITNSNQRALGIIKEEFLTFKSDDLTRIYDNNIPGEWSIIGILNKLVKKDINSNPVTNYRDVVDTLTIACNSLINTDQPEYAITPIVIYRHLHY